MPGKPTNGGLPKCLGLCTHVGDLHVAPGLGLVQPWPWWPLGSEPVGERSLSPCVSDHSATLPFKWIHFVLVKLRLKALEQQPRHLFHSVGPGTWVSVSKFIPQVRPGCRADIRTVMALPWQILLFSPSMGLLTLSAFPFRDGSRLGPRRQT